MSITIARERAINSIAADLKGSEKALLRRAKPLSGKRVLDLGCGDGRMAVLAAERGAWVTAIDICEDSVRSTTTLAQEYGIEGRVRVHQVDAHDIDVLGTFDVVIGKFILHEIEPFDVFIRTLHEVIGEGGRAVFYENNSRNPLLRFARIFLAGRFGIPRFGHNAEFPLEPEEIEEMEHVFSDVSVEYPYFVCFRLANPYLFQHDSTYEPIMDALKKADQLLEDAPLRITQHSYHQVIQLEK